MNGQLDIVFPMARKTDPATSHQSAKEYEKVLSTRRQEVLDLVMSKPGKTAGEYGRIFFGMHPDRPIASCSATPHCRLGELEKLGYVYRGKVRKCTDSDRQCITWYPILVAWK